MKNFFLSLKTAVWVLFGLVCLFFIGSYMMPAHREIFSPMNNVLLFDWIGNIAAWSLWQTWWFFAAIAGLILLTINTIVCSIHAIKGRWHLADFLLRISPQIVHIGFLFILLAHLIGAASGYKVSGMMPEGAFARLPEDRALYLGSVRVETDSAGRMKNWSASVSLYENREIVKNGILGPNEPLFYRGAGIYLQNINFEEGPAAMILVAKDPGAVWALAGSILFTIGSAGLLLLKWKKA